MTVLAPGALVGGYRVEAVVGRGGMGVVYRARHLELGRTAALKVIAPELAADPEFRARFEREARAQAELEHPGVLPVYDAGLRDGLLFLATRLAEGGDLRAALAAGPPAPDVAVDVISQVAAALDAAHGRGLLHRDVKTANILLDGPLRPGVRAYLADFGLVSRTVTQTRGESGHWRGTLDYVAPEQLKGDPVDGRADVYSLGCVLHELLTGVPPYRRENDVATLWAHIAEPPPPLPAALPRAEELGSVTARALAKEPGQRFPSAGALATAARAAVATGTGVADRDPRPQPRDPVAAPVPVPVPVPAGAHLPALAYVLVGLFLGLVFSPGSYDLSTAQLEHFYVRERPPGFWLYVALHVLAQGCLVAHVALLRGDLRLRGARLAADVMYRALGLAVALLLGTLTLRVLPTHRIADSGDVRALRLLYDAAVFLELLALAVLAVAAAAASLAALRSGASRWAVWPPAVLAPTALAGSALALADPRDVLLVDAANAGTLVWVLASGLTVLRPEAHVAETPGSAGAPRRGVRVRLALVLMALVAAGPVLSALMHAGNPAAPLDPVTALETALGASSLGLVVAVWRNHQRATPALLVVQLALALRVLRPAVWSLDESVPSEVWVTTAAGGLLSVLALVLAWPLWRGGAVTGRPRSAERWRPVRRDAARPGRWASGRRPGSPRAG